MVYSRNIHHGMKVTITMPQTMASLKRRGALLPLKVTYSDVNHCAILNSSLHCQARPTSGCLEQSARPSMEYRSRIVDSTIHRRSSEVMGRLCTGSFYLRLIVQNCQFDLKHLWLYRFQSFAIMTHPTPTLCIMLKLPPSKISNAMDKVSGR
jgi:hypothetical protein